jgi:aryl-alcohol dehydrogenase-like predicted oxidoreductase
MERRKLGKSDVEVSALAFGAWAIGGWMWGGSDAREAVKAMETAIDNGMTTIDTASVYGFGLSEELTGKAIKGKRDKVEVLTKFGMSWEGTKGEYYFETKDNSGNTIKIYKYASREKVIDDCNSSLKRLKTDYIDLFQIHWPDATTPVSETMEALEMLVAQGKIRAGGVCNYNLGLVKEAVKTFTLASNQVPYSMVNRKIEEDIVPYCIENNIAILPYSPMQRGLLTGKIKPGYQFNEGDNRPATPYFKEPNLSAVNKILEDIKPIADEHGVTLAQLVLSWTMNRPGMTCTLAGARNSLQVLENLGAATLRLSEEETSRINDKIADFKLVTNI